jgi:hypothetical protein
VKHRKKIEHKLILKWFEVGLESPEFLHIYWLHTYIWVDLVSLQTKSNYGESTHSDHIMKRDSKVLMRRQCIQIELRMRPTAP